MKASQNAVSVGNSLAWHRSFALLQTRPRFILELVLFGYGARLRALHAHKTIEISLYRNWRPR